jgi:hypothetical protein
MEIERNLGEQPLLELMSRHELKSNDLVEASADQLTHKMVVRATKGRRLTANTMGKVQRALNKVSGENYLLKDLFNYAKGSTEGSAEG